MNHSVELSILMPSFNSAKHLPLALSSALHDVPLGVEVVMQDGGSTDGTIEYVRSLSDNRIRLVSEPDDGQADALNRALARARGEWIAWLNADDLIFTGAIRAFFMKLNSLDSGTNIVFGNYATVTGSGETIRDFAPRNATLHSLLYGGHAPFSGALFIRRDFLVAIGAFNSDFTFCMDYELYLRMWSHDTHAVWMDEKIGALRIHSATKTASSPWKFVAEAQRARSPYISGAANTVMSYRAVLIHALAVATTGLRASNLYRRLRRRPPLLAS